MWCSKFPGPQLMAEIGGVHRFKRKLSLVALAKVDLTPNESGEKNIRSNKSAKHGSLYRRKVLFNTMTYYLQEETVNEAVFQFLHCKCTERNPYYV